MASDVAVFLWNKLSKSLAELESDTQSSYRGSGVIKDVVSKFREVIDKLNCMDVLGERYTHSLRFNELRFDILYESNDALADLRVFVHEQRETKRSIWSTFISLHRFISALEMKMKNIEEKTLSLTWAWREIGLPLVMTGPVLSSEVEVFGFDDQSEEIEELLLREEGSGRLRAIGVFGTAGVGKTTLVQKVLEGQRVMDKFKLRLWLSFTGMREGEAQSSIFSFETCIFHELGTIQDESIVGVDNLLERLSQQSSDISYLIVLDDVCHQHLDIVETLCSRLPETSRGAVIVTSRLKEVSQKLGEHKYLIHVKPQEDVCSQILEKKFSSISLGESNEMLEKVRKEIMAPCHGVPLVAKALAELYVQKFYSAA